MQSDGIPPTAQHAHDVVLPADALERKRVLNILAQRRHRRRKKEKLASAQQILGSSYEGQQQHVTSSKDHESSIQPVFELNNSLPTPLSIDQALVDFDWSWLSDSNLIDSAPSMSTISPNVTEAIQDTALQNTTFPDDHTLSMPDLDLLRATLAIGRRLNQADQIFTLTAPSVFHAGEDCSSWTCSLPENLRPTQAQLSLPHPPLLDILPWPQVRSKLIMMYNQPAEVWPRHPKDGSVLNVVRLVYDMEDGGVRVRGPEPWSDEAWNIEQGFFETWWFVLDQHVVRSTNMRRVARGLPELALAS